MRGEERSSTKRSRKRSKRVKRKIWIVFAISCFIISCTGYNPVFYPGYDVLNPSEAVRMNPLGFTDDGNVIVNTAYIQWVDDLQAEIERLRGN